MIPKGVTSDQRRIKQAEVLGSSEWGYLSDPSNTARIRIAQRHRHLTVGDCVEVDRL